jgi:hypothetical protein
MSRNIHKNNIVTYARSSCEASYLPYINKWRLSKQWQLLENGHPLHGLKDRIMRSGVFYALCAKKL